ncbi:MAG TPA: heavy-metal-associated domain-containing protein [Actinomycetota bacterium]
MSEQVLKVPDVTCNHCVSAIEGAVGALGGVERVKVDLDRKEVGVTFDDAETTLEKIVEAIQEEGSEVEGHSSADLLQIGRLEEQ